MEGEGQGNLRVQGNFQLIQQAHILAIIIKHIQACGAQIMMSLSQSPHFFHCAG